MSLHERIAVLLGWTVAEAQSFSLQTLRELVRPRSSKLAQEITDEVRSGRYILGAALALLIVAACAPKPPPRTDCVRWGAQRLCWIEAGQALDFELDRELEERGLTQG